MTSAKAYLSNGEVLDIVVTLDEGRIEVQVTP
jgi:hypothetical protein